MINVLRDPEEWYYYRKVDKYWKKREVFQFAPFPLRIYRDIVNFISEKKKINCAQFSSNSCSPPSNKINIFVRHDIDTKDCMRNLPLILEIDKAQKVPAGIYFRVDDSEYSLADYKETITSYVDDGFEIGLHTLCYLKDDYLSEFQLETEKFSDELGLRPKSFTVHGLGNFRLDVRLRFCEEIAERRNKFGYEFTDCHHKFVSYDYVIEDCHWDDLRQARYIYDDFIQVPSFFKKGRNYLILTHPSYWHK